MHEVNASYVDFHCHLDLYQEFEKIVADCEREKIDTLAVTTTPLAWPRNKQLMLGKKHPRPALGLHPQLVKERSHEIDLWDKYLSEARYVGEVGLDAGPANYSSYELQQEIFTHILKSCSNAGKKVLSIHSVRSVPKVLELLDKHLTPNNCKFVLHWFSGSIGNAKAAVELGAYFSLNSQMIRNERTLNIIKQIPLDRILTETDGPFTERSGMPSHPRDVEQTVGELSSVLRYEHAELKSIISTNLQALLL